MSNNLLAMIFLPGTIIHELSHFLTAVILFVKVGRIEFIPKRTENNLMLGSVEIAKTDPIRRCLIGFAPVLVGTLVVVGAIFLFDKNISFFQSKNVAIFVLSVLVLIYLLFAISNTMFSSSKDVEGAVATLITIGIISLIFYLIGFRVPAYFLTTIFAKNFFEVFEKLSIFLTLPMGIDFCILGIGKIFYWQTKKPK